MLTRRHPVSGSPRCQHRAFSGIAVIVASVAPTACPVGGRYVGYIRKAHEKGYLEHPGSACCTDGMFEIFVLFGRHLCCLLPLFLIGSHLDHQQKPVLIRDEKIKWLDFGNTPDPENLEARPCFEIRVQ